MAQGLASAISKENNPLLANLPAVRQAEVLERLKQLRVWQQQQQESLLRRQQEQLMKLRSTELEEAKLASEPAIEDTGNRSSFETPPHVGSRELPSSSQGELISPPPPPPPPPSSSRSGPTSLDRVGQMYTDQEGDPVYTQSAPRSNEGQVSMDDRCVCVLLVFIYIRRLCPQLHKVLLIGPSSLQWVECPQLLRSFLKLS